MRASRPDKIWGRLLGSVGEMPGRPEARRGRTITRSYHEDMNKFMWEMTLDIRFQGL